MSKNLLQLDAHFPKLLPTSVIYQFNRTCIVAKYIFLILVLLLAACSQNNGDDLVLRLHELEFSRSEDIGAFDPFVKSEFPKIRKLTAEALGKIQSAANVPLIQRLLFDPDHAVQQSAIFALGQIPDQTTREILLTICDDPAFQSFKIQIINAIGRVGADEAFHHLQDEMPEMNVQQKEEALFALTFIASREKEGRKKYLTAVLPYLKNREKSVRAAATYFFSRIGAPPVRDVLIRSKYSPGTLANGWRWKALGRIKNTVKDSLLADSLHQLLTTQLKSKKIRWQSAVHALNYFKQFCDSADVVLAASFLKKDSPHLRAAAINVLGKMDNPLAKRQLVNFYEKADWRDKGMIIESIASQYPKLAHRLIQQNLDQGTTLFKEYLLKSLAQIDEPETLAQLRQFLQVPNVRLKMTAFQSLDDKGHIFAADVTTLLLSGDLALSTIAASWFGEHTSGAKMNELQQAYSLFSEPQGVEPMTAILETMAKLKSIPDKEFLAQAWQAAQSPPVADRLRTLMSKASLPVQKKELRDIPLFVADSLYLDRDSLLATIETNRGMIEISLYPQLAPATVGSFVHLARKGFFDNKTFHRVVPDFVVQGGDPRGDGWGGPGYSIPCEYNAHPYLRGTVGMATAGKDTGGSQFFICHSPQPHLNGRYTVFGQVIRGMDVVDQIQRDDKIKSIKILMKG